MNKPKLLYRIVLWITVSVVALFLLTIGFVYLFKDKIITASITEINKHLNTKIDINPKIDLSIIDKFPQVALGFKDVKIYESIPGSNQLLGQADKLYLTFNILNILDGKYVINSVHLENGNFYLHVDKAGETNYNIFKSTGSTQNKNSGIDLTNISIKNVLVRYENESNEQYYEVLSNELAARLTLEKNSYSISLQGPQLVKTIRVHGNDYFKEKDIIISSSLVYDDTKKTVTILPTSIAVSNSEFNVSGVYAFEKENSVDLKIDNKNGDIQALLSLAPKKYTEIFKDYKSEGDVFFNATIKGVVSETENAALNINFGCKNASFYHPDLKKKITAANFHGNFTNGPQKSIAGSVLKLEGIQFMFDDKLIQGEFLYQNFEKPFIAFEALGSLQANSLLNFYKIPSIKTASGTIDFDIAFKGMLNDLKTKEGHSRITAEGEISLKDISIVQEQSPLVINKCNGTFLFNKNDVAVSEFSTSVGKSDFKVYGLLKNLFGALLLEQGRMLAELDIQGRYWDVEELIAYQTPSEETPEQPTSTEGTFPFLEKYLLRLTVDVSEITYKKVVMNKLKGTIQFDQPLLKMETISFQLAKGDVTLNSTTNFTSEEKIETTLQSELTGLKIDELMYMFDDFGQTFITAQNLKGEFKGTVQTAMNWNSKGEINTKSIIADIDCSILNGELIDFKPMQNLAKFIDAQELAYIKFSELKNKLYIENRKISFPEMQILSNVSDISISGTHTFDNDMDYKLSVPLKNLKKPKIDKDAAFGAIEEDTKKGSTLFLTIKGNVDDYKISYDTKRTKAKIADDLKKEKQEFKNLFKKKEQQLEETVKPNQEEFFDFED